MPCSECSTWQERAKDAEKVVGLYTNQLVYALRTLARLEFIEGRCPVCVGQEPRHSETCWLVGFINQHEARATLPGTRRSA